jgi:hypothetical protein
MGSHFISLPWAPTSRGGPATNMPLCTVSSCILLTDVHLPVWCVFQFYCFLTSGFVCYGTPIADPKKSHFVTNLMLYSFFWVIPRRLNFMCRCFRTLCSILVGGVSTPKHPKERIEHSEHGESLNSRNLMLCTFCATVQYTHSLTSNLLHNIYYSFLHLLSVGLPVVNAPDVLQPCGLLYYP